MRETESKQEPYSHSNNVYFPACASGYTSIVDALKSIGVDSSYNNRATIAANNGISGYSGSASQNNQMLDMLKAGTLLNYVETNTGYTTYYRYRERSAIQITYYRYRERSKIPTVYHFYRDVDEEIYEDSAASKSDVMPLSSNLLKQIANDLSSPFAANIYDDLNGGFPVFEWQFKGDVNCDGAFNIADAVTLQNYILGRIKFNEQQFNIADLNCDENVDVFDMVLMRKLIIVRNKIK